MTDPTHDAVLRMIAERQRETLETVNDIRDTVSGISADVKLNSRDIETLNAWRERHVDPALQTMREARGGLKGFKLALSLMAAGAGGGIVSKLAAAFLASMPK